MEGTKPSSQGVPCNRHNSALSSVLPTLVHIYIPQTYTPCGRLIEDKGLLTLVGLSRWGLPYLSPVVS